MAVATVGAASPVLAQGRAQPPPADPQVVQRGMTVYASTCASCHGTDARGGRGPDLARSLVIIGDPTGTALAAFVRAGTREMPPINLTDAEFSDVAVFVLATAHTASGRRPADSAAVLVGDPAAGETFFKGEGKCASCHSVTGDLKGVGAKYPAQQLQGRIAFPRGRGGYPGFGQATADPALNATAVLTDGRRVSGTVITLSDFRVTLRDATGARYTVIRTEAADVRVTDPLQAHADRLKTMTDKQMHDVTAYLAGVR
ncbi:MAG: c-type cytochrome [Vicinamibacterales bacterium]